MFYEDKPKLIIEKDKTQKTLEVLVILLIGTMFAYNLFYYSDLPQKIPQHFGLDGKVNSYGDKNFVWFMPILAIVICYIMHKLTKHLQSFNYSKKITKENAEHHYKAGIKMMLCINVSIAILFFIINYQTVQVAIHGEAEQMTWTNYAIIFTVIMMTVLPLVFAFIGEKKQIN